MTGEREVGTTVLPLKGRRKQRRRIKTEDEARCRAGERERTRCDEIINIKEDREEERERSYNREREYERDARRDNKYRERQENKEWGGSLVRRMQRSKDSRIKIGAEARIMQERAALTRSQDQDTNPRKKNTRRS